MAEQFAVTGLVRAEDDIPAARLWVAVLERDLPSHERRRPGGPAVLGKAVTDAEGRFRLELAAPTAALDLGFQVIGPNDRQLLVREVAAPGHEDGGEDVLFNATSPLEVTLSVARPPDAGPDGADSEYARLLALIAPELGELAPGDLADDDLDFLARDLGREPDGDQRERLTWLRAAHVLAASGGPIPAAFYGWARTGVPDVWTDLPSLDDPDRRADQVSRLIDEVAAVEATELADALRRAAEARIVPAVLAERADATAAAVRRRRLTSVTVRIVLLSDPGEDPLAGYSVRVEDDGTGHRDLGEDVTDGAGGLLFSYDADPAGVAAPRSVRMLVSGPGLPGPVELVADVAPPEATVRVPIPDPSTGLRESLAAGHHEFAATTLDRLEAAGITGFAELRRRGGLAALTAPGGNPELAGLDPDDVRRLDALTELDLLTPEPAEAAVMLQLRYQSVRALASTPWRRFLSEVADAEDPDTPPDARRLTRERAVQLRAAAQAQVGLLDMLLTGHATDFANGVEW
jgi:hypothetical protein